MRSSRAWWDRRNGANPREGGEKSPTHPVLVFPGPALLPVPLLGSGINFGSVSLLLLPLLGFLGRKSRVFEEIDVSENSRNRQNSCPGSEAPPALGLVPPRPSPAFFGDK